MSQAGMGEVTLVKWDDLLRGKQLWKQDQKADAYFSSSFSLSGRVFKQLHVSFCAYAVSGL